MSRRAALCIASTLSFVLAACGSAAPVEQTTTSAVAGVTTTTVPTMTTTTTTVPATTTTTAAPTTTASALPIAVTWDGENCIHEGPESASVGDVATVTFVNEGDVPADLEIYYLPGGTTLDEFVAAWPAEVDGADDIPSAGTSVAQMPEYPNSVSPGESFVQEVTLRVGRLHAFVCWGGGTSSVVQTVDVATTAMTVGDS